MQNNNQTYKENFFDVLYLKISKKLPNIPVNKILSTILALCLILSLIPLSNILNGVAQASADNGSIEIINNIEGDPSSIYTDGEFTYHVQFSGTEIPDGPLPYDYTITNTAMFDITYSANSQEASFDDGSSENIVSYNATSNAKTRSAQLNLPETPEIIVRGEYKLPTREGYEFVGWSASPDSTEIIDPIRNFENNQVYAIWVNKIAFAVYSADDSSLSFYKREEAPSVGETFNNKTVSAVYSGIENITIDFFSEEETWAPPWYDNKENITKVEIVDTDIQPISTSDWFISLDKITSYIGLEKLDTSNVTNMSGMFYNKSIPPTNISNWNTDNVENMAYMFAGLNLGNLDLSKWNTSKVLSARSMFSQTSFTDLFLPDNFLQNATTTQSMFSGCKATSLDLTKFQTSNVTNMSYMFSGFECASIDFSKLKTEKVTDMSYMFANTDNSTLNLANSNIKRLNTSNVNIMIGMFQAINKKSYSVSIDLTGWDTSKVTDMTRMFDGYPINMQSSRTYHINVSGWNVSNVENFYKMFNWNFHLRTLNISGWYFGTQGKAKNMCQIFDIDSPYITQIDTSTFDTRNVEDISWMFGSLTALTSVNLSSFDTSNVINMEEMFYHCESLTFIDVPQLETQNVQNAAGLFNSCSNLRSIDLSNFDTKNMTNIDRLFQRCSSLTEIDVSRFNTSKVTSMSGVFNGCSKITNLDVSGWDTSKVINMRWLFSGCEKLTSLNLNNWNTGEVIHMGTMFGGCNSLDFNAIDFSKFNTNKLKYISGMFSDINQQTIGTVNELDVHNVEDMSSTFANSQFEYLDLSNWNTSQVINTESMFNGCSKLEILDASNFTLSKASNSRRMFYNCSALTTVYISKTYWSIPYNPANNAYYHGEMFYNCTNLPNFDNNYIAETKAHRNSGGYFKASVPKQAFAIYSATDGSLNFYKRIKVPAVGSIFDNKQVSGVYTGIETSTYTAFTEVPWYNDVSPTLLRTIKVVDVVSPISTAYWFAFKTTYSNFLNNLTIIDLNKLNTSNVTTMKYMFYDDIWRYGVSDQRSLFQILGLSKLDTSKVTNMAYLFNGCNATNLNEAEKFNTSSLIRMDSMFCGVDTITSLDLRGYDVSKVTVIGDTFRNMFSLTTLNLTGWNTSNIYYTSAAFFGCSALVNLYGLENWDTSAVQHACGMFEYCSSLQSISFTYNWNLRRAEDLRSFFESCTSITSADLSNWKLTRYANVGDMFERCTKLVSANLDNLSSGNGGNFSDMFKGCSSLTNVSMEGSFCNGVFSNANAMFMDCTSLPDSTAHYVLSKIIATSNAASMFRNCTSLRNINMDVTNFASYTTTDLSGMFAECTGLETIKAEKWIRAGTTITSFLYNCRNLRSVDSDKWELSSKSTHSLFANCSSLTSINLPRNFYPTEAAAMFYGCSSLTSLDLTHMYTTNLWRTDNMFENCSNLENIFVQPAWNMDKVTLSYNMFQNCTKLPNFNPSYIDKTKAYYVADGYLTDQRTKTAFAVYSADNNSLNFYKRADVPTAGNLFDGRTATAVYQNIETSSYTAASSVPWYSFVTNITNVNFIDNGITPVSTAYWFYGFSNINFRNINGINKLNTNNVIDMNCMFFNCYNLTNLDLSNFNTSNVGNMSSMFYSCWGIKTLDLSNFNTSKTTDISKMFMNCYALTSINLSSFNTSSVTNMSYLFQDCRSLSSMNISNFDTRNVTDLGYAFYDCLTLTSLDLSNFNTTNTTNMARLFAYCSNLTTIYISDLWNTDKVTSSTQMFVSTTRLRNFNSSYTDKTRANYSSTGYLTFKSPTRIDISIPKALYINNLSDSTSAISTSATATNHGSSTNQTTRKINIPGASYIVLTLNYYTESSYDYITIYDKNFAKKTSTSFSGDARTSSKTIVISGDTAYVLLRSDGSVTPTDATLDWVYKITARPSTSSGTVLSSNDDNSVYNFIASTTTLETLSNIPTIIDITAANFTAETNNSLIHSENTPLTTISSSGITVLNNGFDITLKSNEKIVIDNLPASVTYTITEIERTPTNRYARTSSGIYYNTIVKDTVSSNTFTYIPRPEFTAMPSHYNNWSLSFDFASALDNIKRQIPFSFELYRCNENGERAVDSTQPLAITTSASALAGDVTLTLDNINLSRPTVATEYYLVSPFKEENSGEDPNSANYLDSRNLALPYEKIITVSYDTQGFVGWEAKSLIPAKPVDYVLNTTYLYELPSTGQDGGVVIYEILGMSIFIIGVFVFLWKKDLISRKYFAYRERKQKKNNK